MNDTERALCDEIDRHKETQRHLAKAQLRYAACSTEYRRVIADLTACRTNALAAAQEHDALRGKLAEAQAETATAYQTIRSYDARRAYTDKQNNSLRSGISELEGERDALKATLEQAQRET